MKLTQLPSGLSAVITRIDLPPALADRLEALGLRVGEDIEFVRSAPLQDPAEYSVGGSLIALRRPDAASRPTCSRAFFALASASSLLSP